MKISGTTGVSSVASRQVVEEVQVKAVEKSNAPTLTTAQTSPDQEETKPERLEKTVERLNEAVRNVNYSLQFEVADDNRIVIRVIDTERGEVIREIPPKELLDALRRSEDLPRLLLDRKV